MSFWRRGHDDDIAAAGRLFALAAAGLGGALHQADERIAAPLGVVDERGRRRLRGAREGDVATFLQHNGGLRTAPFLVTRFVLLSAKPGTGGPPYAVEADYPFDGTGLFEEEDDEQHDAR